MNYQKFEFVDHQLAMLTEEKEARLLAAKYRMRAEHEHLTVPTVNLLIKTELSPWESLESIFFRASALNHLSGISALQRALMLPDNGMMSIKRHLQLSVALGHELRTLSPAIPTLMSKSTLRLYGNLLPTKQVALTSYRVCPRCLEETGYGRSYWSLASFTVCETHNCRLIDSCPICEKTLSGTRPAYDRCSCGVEYSKIDSTSCSGPLHEMSIIIASKFKNQQINNTISSYPNDVLSMGLPDILELLAFLGALSENPGTTYLNLSRKVVSLKYAHRIVKKATDALLDWPNGFHRLLASARSFRSYNETQASVYKSISHITGVMPIGSQQRWSNFILSGIESFLSRCDAWGRSSF
ncbi:TniQ family protein [Pseudomonas sp. NPDC087336]|uniref:TniQ family protein n=1 Tax=Pseudomonas sp. NPDC087336 TaxID=3364436 RepID=UPI003800F3A7